jgi:hypothetical protein
MPIMPQVGHHRPRNLTATMTSHSEARAMSGAVLLLNNSGRFAARSGGLPYTVRTAHIFIGKKRLAAVGK